MEKSQSTSQKNMGSVKGQGDTVKTGGYYTTGSPKKLVLVLKKMNLSGGVSGGGNTQKESGNSVKYKCFCCCLSFRNLQSYTKHIKIHKIDSRYKCPDCNVPLSSKYILDRHMKKKHGRQIGSVPQKSKNTKSKTQTQAKTDINSTTRYKFKCAYCSLLFTSAGGFRKHELAHESKYQCKICRRQLKNPITLARHYNLFHVTAKIHRCMLCSKSFESDHLLRKHIVRNHQETYKCCECNISYTVAKDLEYHLKEHSETCTLICTYCHEDISDLSGFVSHIMVCRPVKQNI
ncbi:zinc finger Y-chromosomal protein 2-like isoform X2 [Oratosquilla oratoria]|uniref:zinc finger Y-chromosomal protein 2-like isoform X2 n=1 Tax=Oratosquilla oratoria TaxID=337810 RepID=UPI003F76FA16